MKNELTAEWKHVEWVFTDVDDTLTWQGSLPPESLLALKRLQENNIKVVAVTGACAGWCDHIAQLWPVDAVLGENGAFLLEKSSGALSIETERPLNEVRSSQEKLKAEILKILEEYPELSLTLDQPYRLCEVAIDIGQNRAPIAPEMVEHLLTKIHALGAHATASSIHINAWYGEHSKKHSSLQFLTKKGLTRSEVMKKCCYVGDSMNDQQMFATLPLTAGVSNIQHYWSQLSHHPSVVMTQPGGFGFAEFSDKLIQIKRNGQ